MKRTIWGVIGVLALVSGPSAYAATTIGNNVSVGGTLDVAGASTLTGAATLSSTLSVTGLSTLTGGFISAASSSVSAGLQVAGNLSASSTMSVAGAATLASTLSVSSLATLTGGFISAASSSVSSRLQVAGNLSASSTMTVGGAATLSSTLSVSGASTLEGDVTLGNATSTDKWYLNAKLTGSIIPSTNESMDLGQDGVAFTNIYASGTIYGGVAQLESGTQGAPALSFIDRATTGFYSDGDIVATISGQKKASIAGNRLSPVATSYDLGRFSGQGYEPWNNIYASGTLYAASSTIFFEPTTTTVYIKSGGTATGGRIVLEDSDGNGCYEVYVNNGTLTTGSATCPD